MSDSKNSNDSQSDQGAVTLEYLWIEDYKCIKRQGINFGGEYLFSVYIVESGSKLEKGDKNTENRNKIKEIIVKSECNPFYIKGFYNAFTDDKSKANISNITALVGKNGSGKTTIFDFMKEFLPDGKSTIKTNCIFIVRAWNGDYKLYCYTSINTKLDIDLDISITQETIDYSRINTKDEILLDKPFVNIHIIFFANIFDQRREANEFEGFSNISTSYLIWETAENETDNKNNKVGSYYKKEIEKQLMFIGFHQQKENEYYLPFSLPKTVRVVNSRERTLDNTFITNLNNYKNESLKKLFENLYEAIDPVRYKYTEPYDVVIPFISKLLIHMLVSLYGQAKNHPEIIDITNRGLDQISNGVYLCKSVDGLKKLIKALSEIKNSFEEKFKRLLELTKHLEKDTKDEVIIRGKTSDEFLYMIETADKITRVRRFLNSYFESTILGGIVEFSWEDLSSGQVAMFNIYSRFHYLINPIKVSPLEGKDLLILLDEPDVYLHPEWQRCFIETFTRYISSEYSINQTLNDNENRNRNIQIVYSTNNPLSLSDILPTNVVRIERQEDGRMAVVKNYPEYSDFSTFASNVYELLKNSFFLESGYIGSFAKRKIEEVNSFINEISKDTTESSENKCCDKKLEEIRRIISAIGEPVIRNYLSSKLESEIKKYKGKNDFLCRLRDYLEKNRIQR